MTARNKDERKPLTALDLGRSAILHGLEEPFATKLCEEGALAYLGVRQPIYRAEEEIREVYFPLNSVLSIVTSMKDGHQIEVGTVGREGMSALPLLMGASTTANDSYCQVPGEAIQIKADLFQKMSVESRKFRSLLDRYLQAYMNMLGQLATCNRLHSVYERCSRWLLLTHDRVGSDVIPLTHEFLAMMLGTNRSGVTISAATLQQAGFIKSSHGKISILDRKGLEDASCECYEVAQKQFGGLLRSASDKPNGGAA